MRAVLLTLMLMSLLVGAVSAQPVIVEKFPPNGSWQAGACGPFGVRLTPGTITDYEDALVVRGSATGRRRQGVVTLSAAGDSLYFVPAVPFAPGEDVTVTVLGSLRDGGTPLVEGHTWRVHIQPGENALIDDLSSMSESTISLANWFSPNNLEFLSAGWADLDGDAVQEGVLLVDAGGTHNLQTIYMNTNAGPHYGLWSARVPALCTVDNPVELKLLDLDEGSRRDLILLTLSGLQVWRNPGLQTSPLGADAAWTSFPAGFNARALAHGDLDSDGDEDIVVVGLFGQQYLVYLNDGNGGLSASGVVSAADGGGDKSVPWPIEVLLDDANGDGTLDLIWGADYQESGQYPIRLALGLGDGRFAAAEVLTTSNAFAGKLAFGRLFDPWSSSETDPMVLVTQPSDGASSENLCGYTFTGALTGCLAGDNLTIESGPTAVANFLVDTGGDAGYPELLYANPQNGVLSLQPLSAGATRQTRTMSGLPQAVYVGDFDYDGDGDVMVALPGRASLLLLLSPGGAVPTAPGPGGVGSGGVMDFGDREINCAEAAIAGHIPFVNDGMRPARIQDVVLDDPAGVFSLETHPLEWFGQGCLGELSTVMVPLNFAPTDTLDYTANLTVTLLWADAGAAGDSTLVCDFTLTGSGSVFGADDGGTGLGALTWSEAQGYATVGGTVDFGLLPALTGIQTDAAFSLTNTGDFVLEIEPPSPLPALWQLSPAGVLQIAPGATQDWALQVQPTPDMIPANVDTLDASTTLSWAIRSGSQYHCLPNLTLEQTLNVQLLSVDPCLAIDPDCEANPATMLCAAVDTLTVMEGQPFSWCLEVLDWRWPGADPQLEIIENPLDWVSLKMVEPLADETHHVGVLSEEVGAIGGTIEFEVRDVRFQTQALPFSLTIIVEPAYPDLRVLELVYEPGVLEGEIQQQDPFYVDVVVESLRRPVEGADLTLNGEECYCGVDPLGKSEVNLAEGQRDTIRFTVEYCDEAGNCGFTACIEPPGGLENDFDPNNNCFTSGIFVAANRAPVIQFYDLTLSPADPALEPCDGNQTWNQIVGGQVEILGVREENSLSVSARAVDTDGDARRLAVLEAPDFVQVTVVNDTVLDFVISPPEGLVTLDVCEDFGNLVLQSWETSVAVPETTTLAVPVMVKWEGADLAVSLVDVPGSAKLQDTVRFTGRVRCIGYNAGPFTAEMRLTDPLGQVAALRQIDIPSLTAGSQVVVPQILHQVDVPGEYCARIRIITGRDINPLNNDVELCFHVDSGPFVVSPNVATPNGDGHNDNVYFQFNNQTVNQPSVRVFELSGRKVFESDQLDGQRRLAWDGRDLDGRLVPPGSYVYIIYDDGNEFRKGTCGVVR